MNDSDLAVKKWEARDPRVAGWFDCDGYHPKFSGGSMTCEEAGESRNHRLKKGRTE